MNNQRLIELLLKEKNDSLSSIEKEELIRLKDTLHTQSVIRKLGNFINAPLSFTDEVSESRIDQSAEKLLQKIRINEDKRVTPGIPWRKIFAVAASLLLVISTTIFYLQKPHSINVKTISLPRKKVPNPI